MSPPLLEELNHNKKSRKRLQKIEYCMQHYHKMKNLLFLWRMANGHPKVTILRMALFVIIFAVV